MKVSELEAHLHGNTQQSVGKSLHYISSGYQHIVEIDLKQFFDRVDHVLLLQLLYT